MLEVVLEQAGVLVAFMALLKILMMERENQKELQLTEKISFLI